MRTIVHLSDLHFGRTDPEVVAALAASVEAARPDLIAVSGDLTQRARAWQFKEARAFLDALPRAPRVVVPGNHDVPLWNFFARFARPLDNFRRYVTDDLEPFYADAEVVVAGVNTARSLTTKYGRINERQIARVRERFCAYADDVTKIVVTHHPFDVPEGRERDLVGRAALAMEALAACGADVLLAGHLHLAHTGQTAKRYRTAGHSALVVQAGTAASTRVRGEANSYNVLKIRHPFVNVVRLAWAAARKDFTTASSEHFRHTPDGWARVPDEMAADITYEEPPGAPHRASAAAPRD
jgi:3',5'-cyclic AMP phosphodiesterase CpdA